MQNRLTNILGVDYPLILGPMRLITLGAMAAAMSNAGGFGQIASSMLSPSRLRDEIRKAKNLTNKPFGINIPLHRPNAFDALELAQEESVPVITTSGGSPGKITELARATGIKVLHKVSTSAMALKAQKSGVDGVIAMGFEAGGHGGKEQVTTLCLVPRLADVLDIPVIAAGGISDYRGFLAALALGADGVEVGTRFLGATECPIPMYYKEAVLNADETGTILVGKTMPIRLIKNEAAGSIIEEGKEESNKAEVFDYSSLEGSAESATMPAGQGVGLIDAIKPIQEIISEFMSGSCGLSATLCSFFKEGI